MKTIRYASSFLAVLSLAMPLINTSIVHADTKADTKLLAKVNKHYIKSGHVAMTASSKQFLHPEVSGQANFDQKHTLGTADYQLNLLTPQKYHSHFYVAKKEVINNNQKLDVFKRYQRFANTAKVAKSLQDVWQMQDAKPNIMPTKNGYTISTKNDKLIKQIVKKYMSKEHYEGVNVKNPYLVENVDKNGKPLDIKFDAIVPTDDMPDAHLVLHFTKLNSKVTLNKAQIAKLKHNAKTNKIKDFDDVLQFLGITSWQKSVLMGLNSVNAIAKNVTIKDK